MQQVTVEDVMESGANIDAGKKKMILFDATFKRQCSTFCSFTESSSMYL